MLIRQHDYCTGVSHPLSVSGACLAICCDESGKCVQLNWSSILLDGYKKLSLPWQRSCEDRRVKTIDSTGQGHRQRI